jgi:hypothetical protein
VQFKVTAGQVRMRLQSMNARKNRGCDTLRGPGQSPTLPCGIIACEAVDPVYNVYNAGVERARACPSG